jgi:hypothetical protein
LTDNRQKADHENPRSPGDRLTTARPTEVVMLSPGSTLAVVLLVVFAVGMFGWRRLITLAATAVIALAVVGFIHVIAI